MTERGYNKITTGEFNQNESVMSSNNKRPGTGKISSNRKSPRVETKLLNQGATDKSNGKFATTQL
jgi:hypothetical protein